MPDRHHHGIDGLRALTQPHILEHLGLTATLVAIRRGGIGTRGGLAAPGWMRVCEAG